MKPTKEYVSLHDLASEPDYPSRAALYELVKRERIARYKFAGDRRTYVKRSEIERLLRTPRRKR